MSIDNNGLVYPEGFTPLSDSWYDPQSYGLPLTSTDPITSKFLNLNTTFENKKKLVEYAGIQKSLNLDGFNNYLAVFSDGDSGEYYDANGIKRKFRLADFNKLDTVDQLKAIEKSKYKQRTQPKYVSEFLGKPENMLTEQDYSNVDNYHKYATTNYIRTGKIEPFNPYQDYTKTKVEPVNIAFRKIGTDSYGRDLVEAVNPQTMKHVSFDMSNSPDLNASFDITKSLDTPYNRKRLNEYIQSHPTKQNPDLDKLRSLTDNDWMIGEDIDLLQSAFMQSGARIMNVLGKIAPDGWVDKKKWKELSTQRGADIWAGVRPETRKEYETEMSEAIKDLDSGNRARGIFRLLKQTHRVLMDSAPQMSMMLAAGALTGGIGAAAGTYGWAGTASVLGNGLVQAGIGAATAALDQTLINIEDFEKNNPGKKMSTEDIVKMYLGNIPLLIPDAILGRGIVSKSWKNLLNPTGRTTAMRELGRDITKSFGYEGAQEYGQDVFNEQFIQNQEHPKSLAEIMMSPEMEASFWSGGFAGAGMQGLRLPSVLRTAKKEQQIVDDIQKQQTIDSEQTLSGNVAPEDINKNYKAQLKPFINQDVTSLDDFLDVGKKIRAIMHAKDASAEVAGLAERLYNSKAFEYVASIAKDESKLKEFEDRTGLSKEKIVQLYARGMDEEESAEIGRTGKFTSKSVENREKVYEFASRFGFTKTETNKLMAEVESDVYDSHGRGLNFYKDGMDYYAGILQDQNVSSQERAEAKNSFDFYLGETNRFANLQADKAMTFAMNFAEMNKEGTSRRTFIYPHSKSKFELRAEDLVGEAPDSDKGGTGVFNKIVNSVYKMGDNIKQYTGDTPAFVKRAESARKIFNEALTDLKSRRIDYGKEETSMDEKTAFRKGEFAIRSLAENKNLTREKRQRYTGIVESLSDNTISAIRKHMDELNLPEERRNKYESVIQEAINSRTQTQEESAKLAKEREKARNSATTLLESYKDVTKIANPEEAITEIAKVETQLRSDTSEESKTVHKQLVQKIQEIAKYVNEQIAPLNISYDKKENTDFSSRQERSFKYDGKQYKSIEQAYQSLKSGTFDQEIYDKFDKKPDGTFKGKNVDKENNIKLMENLVYESFKQNPDVAKKLIDTGTKQFSQIEDNSIWKDEYPRILTDVREKLKSELGTSNEEGTQADTSTTGTTNESQQKSKSDTVPTSNELPALHLDVQDTEENRHKSAVTYARNLVKQFGKKAEDIAKTVTAKSLPLLKTVRDNISENIRGGKTARKYLNNVIDYIDKNSQQVNLIEAPTTTENFSKKLSELESSNATTEKKLSFINESINSKAIDGKSAKEVLDKYSVRDIKEAINSNEESEGLKSYLKQRQYDFDKNQGNFSDEAMEHYHKMIDRLHEPTSNVAKTVRDFVSNSLTVPFTESNNNQTFLGKEDVSQALQEFSTKELKDALKYNKSISTDTLFGKKKKLVNRQKKAVRDFLREEIASRTESDVEESLRQLPEAKYSTQSKPVTTDIHSIQNNLSNDTSVQSVNSLANDYINTLRNSDLSDVTPKEVNNLEKNIFTKLSDKVSEDFKSFEDLYKNVNNKEEFDNKLDTLRVLSEYVKPKNKQQIEKLIKESEELYDSLIAEDNDKQYVQRINELADKFTEGDGKYYTESIMRSFESSELEAIVNEAKDIQSKLSKNSNFHKTINAIVSNAQSELNFRGRENSLNNEVVGKDGFAIQLPLREALNLDSIDDEVKTLNLDYEDFVNTVPQSEEDESQNDIERAEGEESINIDLTSPAGQLWNVHRNPIMQQSKSENVLSSFHATFNQIMSDLDITNYSEKISGIATHGFLEDGKQPIWLQWGKRRYSSIIPSVDKNLVLRKYKTYSNGQIVRDKNGNPEIIRENPKAPIVYYVKSGFETMPQNAILYNTSQKTGEGETKPVFEFNDYSLACLQLAEMNFLATGGLNQFFVNPQRAIIANIHGKTEDTLSSELESALREVMQNEGVFASHVYETLGSTAMQLMGITKSNADNADIQTFSRVKTGVGLTVLQMLEKDGILDVQEVNIKDKYIERVANTLRESLRNKKDNKGNQYFANDVIEKKVDEDVYSMADEIWSSSILSEVYNGNTNYVMVKLKKDKDGKPANSRLRTKLIDLYVGKDSKEGLRDRLGINLSEQRGPSSKPIHKVDTVIARTRGIARLNNMQTSSLDSLQATEYQFVTRLVSQVEENIDNFANMMGFVPQEELVKMHKDQRISALGANRAIVNQLHNLILYSRAQRTGKADGFFFKWFISRTGRYNIDSNTVNPHAHKDLLRFLMRPSSNYVTWYDGSLGVEDVVNPDDNTQVRKNVDRFRLIEAYTISQAFDKNSSEWESLNLLDKFDSLSNKDFSSLYATFCQKTNDEFIEKAKSLGLDLDIENIGQILLAFNHMSNRRKSNGKQFKSWLSVEEDSTTSGFFLRFLFFPLQELVKNGTNKRLGILNQSELIDMYQMKKMKGFDDTYQYTIRKARDIFAALLGSRTDLNTKQFILYDPNAKTSKNETQKLRLERSIYQSKLTTISPQIASTIFEKILPSMPLSEMTEKISSALRKLAKDPTMTYGYTSGMKSTIRAIANAIIQPQVDQYYQMYHSGELEAYIKNNNLSEEKAKIATSIWNTFQYLDSFVSKQYGESLGELLKTKTIYDIYVNIPHKSHKVSEIKATSLFDIIHSGIAPTIGTSIWESLEDTYKPWKAYTEATNLAFANISGLFIDVYKNVLSDMKKANNGKITNKMYRELIEQLRPLMPIISTSFSDGEYNGLVVTQFEKEYEDVTRSVHFEFKDKNGERYLRNFYAPSDTFTVTKNSGAVYPIHSSDAQIMSYIIRTVQDMMGIEFLPVHDAAITSSLFASTLGQMYNRTAFNLCSQYNVFEVIVDKLKSVMSLYEQYAKEHPEWHLNTDWKNRNITDNFGNEFSKNSDKTFAHYSFDEFLNAQPDSGLNSLSQLTTKLLAARQLFYGTKENPNSYVVNNMSSFRSAVRTSDTIRESIDGEEFRIMQDSKERSEGYPEIRQYLEHLIDTTEVDSLTNEDYRSLLFGGRNNQPLLSLARKLEHSVKILTGEKQSEVKSLIEKLDNFIETLNGNYEAITAPELAKEREIAKLRSKQADIFKQFQNTDLARIVVDLEETFKKNGITDKILNQQLQQYNLSRRERAAIKEYFDIERNPLISDIEGLKEGAKEKYSLSYILSKDSLQPAIFDIDSIRSSNKGMKITGDIINNIANFRELNKTDTKLLRDFVNLTEVPDIQQGSLFDSKGYDPLGVQDIGQHLQTFQKAMTDPKERVTIIEMMNDYDKKDGRSGMSSLHLANVCSIISQMDNSKYKDMELELREGLRATGKFYPDKNKITVWVDKGISSKLDPVTNLAITSSQSLAETTAHEMIHPAIILAFQMQDDLGINEDVNRILSLMRDVISQFTKEDFMPDNYDKSLQAEYERFAENKLKYFSKNPEEFIAYGITNEKIANKLRNMNYGRQPSNKKVFHRIVDFISSIFKVLFKGEKISNVFTDFGKIFNKDIAAKKYSNAYEALSQFTIAISRANNKAQQQSMSRMTALHEMVFNSLKEAISWANGKLVGWKNYISHILDGNGLYRPRFLPTKVQTLTDALRYFALMPFSQQARESCQKMFNHLTQRYQQGFILSVMRDILISDRQTQKLAELITHTRMFENAAKGLETLTFQRLEKANGKPFTTEEKMSLHYAVLKTDIQCLDRTMDDIRKLLTDKQYLDSEILGTTNVLQQLLSSVKSLDIKFGDMQRNATDQECMNWLMSEINALAYYQVHGKGNEAMKVNAHQIAQIFGLRENTGTPKKDAQRFIDTIDELATLIALKHTDQSFKNIAANTKALSEFVKLHKQYVKESYVGIFDPEFNRIQHDYGISQQTKGYFKNVYDNSIEVISAPKADNIRMYNEGYDYIADMPDDDVLGHYGMAFYRRTNVNMRKRAGQGVMARGEDLLGKSIKNSAYEMALTGNTFDRKKFTNLVTFFQTKLFNKKNELDKKFASQMLSFDDFDSLKTTGYILGTEDYYLTTPYDFKKQHMGLIEDGVETLSKMYASRYTRVNSISVNSAIEAFLLQDMKENMRSNHATDTGKHYVKLEPNSNNAFLSKNWRLIPRNIRDKAEQLSKPQKVIGTDGQPVEVEGTGFWVRSDWLQSLFGIESTSLTNIKAVDKMLPPIAKRAIHVAEYIMSAISALAKGNIVLKVPGVLIGNIVSNANQSIMNGESPLTVFKMTLDNMRATKQFLDDRRTYNSILFKERMREATNQDLIEKNILLKKMQNNRVFPLIQKGMFQTVVEDMDSSQVESLKKFKRFTSTNKFIGMIPEGFKTVAKHLYMSEGSFVYDFMNLATQFSDFASRCTEYQLRMKKAPKKFANPMDKDPTPEWTAFDEKLTHDLWDMFVNYDTPQAAPLQYLNDMGILMFTKYALRIQKMVQKNLLNNPAGVIFALLTQSMLTDTDNIMEQNAFNKHWSALVNTPWGNISNVLVPMPLQFMTGMRGMGM